MMNTMEIVVKKNGKRKVSQLINVYNPIEQGKIIEDFIHNKMDPEKFNKKLDNITSNFTTHFTTHNKANYYDTNIGANVLNYIQESADIQNSESAWIRNLEQPDCYWKFEIIIDETIIVLYKNSIPVEFITFNNFTPERLVKLDKLYNPHCKIPDFSQIPNIIGLKYLDLDCSQQNNTITKR